MGISSFGDGLVLVAFPLLALTLTTNPLAIAGVAVAGRLPALLLAVPAGAVADRVDRRRLAVAVSAARALALAAFAGIVIAGADRLVFIYATVFVLGAGDMTFDVAAQACLPSMLPQEKLAGANGYLYGAEVTGEQFLGPALGGIAFAAAPAAPFVADALSFVAQAGLAGKALPRKTIARKPTRFGADVREGLRWFLGHPLLRLLAAVIAALAFCQAMVNAEMVIYGTKVLGLGNVGYGLFFAGAAVGNVVGSFAAGRVHGRLGPAVCLAGAAIISGFAYLVLSVTSTVGVAVSVFFIESAAIVIGNVTTLTLRQRVIPKELLGRVGGAFRTLLFGFMPLGALAGGVATQALGVRHAFALAGALQLFAFAVAGPAVIRRIRAEMAQTRPTGLVHTGISREDDRTGEQNEGQWCDGAAPAGEAGASGTPI